jgi:hypothetical protein
MTPQLGRANSRGVQKGNKAIFAHNPFAGKMKFVVSMWQASKPLKPGFCIGASSEHESPNIFVQF